MRRLVILVSVVVLALAFVMAAPAFAAKGGQGKGGGNGGGKGKPGGGDSSLSLVMVTDVNDDGLPNWGDQVTFDVATTATDQPFVGVNCYQSGVLVYSASAGFFEGYPWPQQFTLSSSYWTGGDADCTATLYWTDGRRSRDLASLSFHASA